MNRRVDAVQALARFLSQRAELSEADLYLAGLSREEALELACAAARPVDGGDGRQQRAVAAEAGADVSAAPAPEPAPNPREVLLPEGYEELRQAALACTRGRLAEGRTQVVFADGNPDARVMVVGEAPGANEDATGLPFVGAAGQFLDLLLATVGLSRRENVYIANVLKCRPPGNRDPLPDEIEACAPFLHRQIDLVRPEALLAVGSFAARLLTGREKSALGRLRGTVHSYRGIPLVVTYHPAALLRNPKWIRPFWDDLQLLTRILDA